jgi:hypothetical protein
MTIFEVCAIISVVIFAILAFFAIRTLCALQQNLVNVNNVTQEISHKMKLMDSTFKSISALGDMSEIKLNELRDEQIKFNEFVNKKDFTNKTDYSEDLTDLVLASLRLGIKLFRR